MTGERNAPFFVPKRDLRRTDAVYDEVTEHDIQKMQEEIDYRRTVLRPQLTKEVQEARSQGVLSDNFEYHAAKTE